jgi:hypothetical protein
MPLVSGTRESRVSRVNKNLKFMNFLLHYSSTTVRSIDPFLSFWRGFGKILSYVSKKKNNVVP